MHALYAAHSMRSDPFLLVVLEVLYIVYHSLPVCVFGGACK
jgi:hypothetical protein